MPQVGSNNCSLFFLAILYQTLEQYHKYVVLCRITHNANIKLSEGRKCKGINSEPLIQVANLEHIFGKYNKKNCTIITITHLYQEKIIYIAFGKRTRTSNLTYLLD